MTRCDDSSSGIWLYAIFMTAIEKTGPLIRVSIISIGSIGQPHLVASVIVFNWQLSRTIINDSHFWRIFIELINVFPVVRESVFTCAMISKCVRISSECCILSRNCRSKRVARCFLNTAVAFNCKFKSTLIFPASKLDVL